MAKQSYIRMIVMHGSADVKMTMKNLSNAIEHIEKVDPHLRPYLKDFTLPLGRYSKNPFKEMVRLIISQQLSGSAAETIFARLQLINPLTDTFSAPAMLLVDTKKLRACGLSSNKTSYILSLARLLSDNPRYFDGLADLSDEDAVNEIVRLKGIGEWTANLFLMTYFDRYDVFPHGDASLKKAIWLIYGFDAEGNKEAYSAILERWSPYRSVVARVLWRALDQKLIV